MSLTQMFEQCSGLGQKYLYQLARRPQPNCSWEICSCPKAPILKLRKHTAKRLPNTPFQYNQLKCNCPICPGEIFLSQIFLPKCLWQTMPHPQWAKSPKLNACFQMFQIRTHQAENSGPNVFSPNGTSWLPLSNYHWTKCPDVNVPVQMSLALVRKIKCFWKDFSAWRSLAKVFCIKCPHDKMLNAPPPKCLQFSQIS